MLKIITFLLALLITTSAVAQTRVENYIDRHGTVVMRAYTYNGWTRYYSPRGYPLGYSYKYYYGKGR